jgi:transcriptional regulator with XRE-family HTH domain
MPALDTFAGRLAYARDLRGLSRRELAALVDLSHPAVGHYEEGRRDPQLQTVAALAVALGVRPEWLAFGVGALPAVGAAARLPGKRRPSGPMAGG